MPTRSRPWRRPSAVKHMHADKKKRDRNRHRKSELRTVLNKAEKKMAEGNAEEAQALYLQATSHLDRAAQKGVIKKGMANRKKSRLARRLNQIAVA